MATLLRGSPKFVAAPYVPARRRPLATVDMDQRAAGLSVRMSPRKWETSMDRGGVTWRMTADARWASASRLRAGEVKAPGRVHYARSAVAP